MVYGTYNELVTGAFVNQLTSLGGGQILWRSDPLDSFGRSEHWCKKPSSAKKTSRKGAVKFAERREAARFGDAWMIPSGKHTKSY